MLNNNNIDALDIIALVSFFIGLANYEENVDQNTMQDAIGKAVKDIHKHLEMQDDKIELILNSLGGVEK